MKKKLTKTVYLVIFLMFFVSNLVAKEKEPQKVQDLISLIQQRSGLEIHLSDIGWQWQEADCKGTPELGEVTFRDQKWLMYLIHWGPIQSEDITVDYVKKRMLNMWGVNFAFNGKEGKTTIAGHDAVFVEAFGTGKSFYTRFIIWNCPESGREFIADTNYNLIRKTPTQDFETQRRSANTIRCHDKAQCKHFPDLTKTFTSRKYGFSFDYPGRWFVFDSPYYVPFPQYEGIRDKNMGSLLGLCSDQNIQVTLKWYSLTETKAKQEKNMFGSDTAAIENLFKELKSWQDLERFQNHGTETFNIKNKKVSRIWGTCECKTSDKEKKDNFLTGKGIYQIASCDLREKGKKIIIFLLTKEYRYGTEISCPSKDYQDRLLKDLLLKKLQE